MRLRFAIVEEWVAALKAAAEAATRPLDGTIALEGFPGEARITTDRWGVPHVDAPDRDALYAAQGYLHATERLWQTEFNARLARGRLSELVGEPAYGVDRYFRTIGLGRIVRDWMKRGLDERSERIARAYYHGFVAGARSVPPPVEFQILAAEPSIPNTFEEALESSMAISALIAFGLSMNWTLELLRFQLASELGAERAMELAPFMGLSPASAVPPRRNPTGAVADLLATARIAGSGAPGIGSNNWVLAGSRTTTGAPLLCNDPHLLVQMPAIWMEMHLRCPDLDVTGVSLPGLPGILIGHNDRVAWGFTNTQADVADLYLEKLNDDGSAYLHDDEWLPLDVIHEEITVRNEPDPRIHVVRATKHGPLITDLLVGATDTHVRENAIEAPLALRWIHAGVPVTQHAIEALNSARDWDSFRAAARVWPSVGQNMVYADVDGHIGYQFTGTYPVRTRGTGAAPAPGWDPSYDWSGVIPFDELPWAFDPPNGVLATANNRVVGLDYPHLLTEDWEPAYRIRRINEVLSSRETHGADDMAALQADTHSGIADELVPALRHFDPQSGDAKVAAELLQAWDRRMDAGSSGAALFACWLDELARELFHTELGETLFDLYHTSKSWVSAFATEATLDRVTHHPKRAHVLEHTLAAAWRSATERLGDDPSRWRWGAVHHVTFSHPLGRALPPLAALLSNGPFEAPGGDDTVNRGTYVVGENFQTGGIPSYRQIVDLGDFDRSRSVISTGCSGNPASPYYTNQTQTWLDGEHHPMLFSAGAVAANAVGTLIVTRA